MLREIFRPDDIIEFRCIHPDRSGGHKPQQFWSVFSKAGKIKPTLKKLNQEGYGVYYGLLPRKEEGKGSDADVVDGNILWADFDYSHKRGEKGIDIDEVRESIEDSSLPEPSIYVNSGHGIHAYWLLQDRHSPDVIKSLNEKIQKQFKSDSVSNPSRIFRLPGFVNTKQPQADCVIIEETGEFFSLDDFVFDFVEEKSQHKKIEQINIECNSDNMKRAKTYIEKVEGSGAGGRTTKAFKIACILVNDFSLNDIDSRMLLSDWDLSKNNPPIQGDSAYPANELDKIINNAHRYHKKPEGNKENSSFNQKPKEILKVDSKPVSRSGYRKRLEDFASGKIKSINFSGFNRLRDATGLGRRTNYVVIAGPEGEGKSMLAMNICIAAHRAGHRFAYLPLEDMRDDWEARALAILAGSWKPIQQEQQSAEESIRLHDEYQTQLDGLLSGVAENPMKMDIKDIDGEIPLVSPDTVINWIKDVRDSVDIMVIDCLSQIEFGDREMHRGEGKFIKRIEMLSQDKIIMLVCHTRRKAGGERKLTPHADDVQGSKMITRRAHIGLLLTTHDEKTSTIYKYGSTTELHEHERTINIIKARNSHGKGKSIAVTMQEGGFFKELGVIKRE